ncbi:LysR family transcriptional regulator [Xanthomonas euroxanthea]|uniref:LysR family transcriptional regulator n=1 Tax=Xanthomonas euroxanthea TaxID=2259622 RepID=A0AA46C8M3_9XANT|nr:LysR family transcriptional regulator [Xanthomonas euroxanthea]CAE1136297.1 LysR family transcriptional regulator [Xanthomonas euroxanthea]SUZ28357.1 LysR family transcriptional regulator [Xanthomonas euroxanthea]
MAKHNINDLLAFVTVAREGSFTRAAATLEVSQSALSHTISGLEARLGVRLLTRTTRSVIPTEAGDRFYRSLAPRFEVIEEELAAVRDLHDRPSGTIRISAAEHAAMSVLYPKLKHVLAQHPGIQVEVTIDYALGDIVAQGYDAGVRLGDHVAKDMVAVRISPDLRIAVVGSPDYFASHVAPVTPQNLAEHNCINRRLQTNGGIYTWEFSKGQKEMNVRVQGQWVFNSSSPALRAALDGYGLAYLPEDMVEKHLESGRLIRVLDDWCEPFQGYFLYYPNRRHSSRTLQVVTDALRYRVD